MYNIAIVHLYTTTHKIHCSLHIARNEHGKKCFKSQLSVGLICINPKEIQFWFLFNKLCKNFEDTYYAFELCCIHLSAHTSLTESTSTVLRVLHSRLCYIYMQTCREKKRYRLPEISLGTFFCWHVINPFDIGVFRPQCDRVSISPHVIFLYVKLIDLYVRCIRCNTTRVPYI